MYNYVDIAGRSSARGDLVTQLCPMYQG